jgi:hypothetical protein
MSAFRWLMAMTALFALMGCVRGEPGTNSSGIRSPSMTDPMEQVPLPTERSTYMWADP